MFEISCDLTFPSNDDVILLFFLNSRRDNTYSNDHSSS